MNDNLLRCLNASPEIEGSVQCIKLIYCHTDRPLLEERQIAIGDKFQLYIELGEQPV